MSRVVKSESTERRRGRDEGSEGDGHADREAGRVAKTPKRYRGEDLLVGGSPILIILHWFRRFFCALTRYLVVLPQGGM